MRRSSFIVFLITLGVCLSFSSRADASLQSKTQTLHIPSGAALEAQIQVWSAEIEDSKKQSPQPKPAAILVFGGFQNAAKVLDLLTPHLEGIGVSDVVLASFDYPFEPPRKFEFPASLRFAAQAKLMIHQTVEGIVELRRHLIEKWNVDPHRITLIGASLGAPFAALAAQPGLFPGLVFVHGFGEIQKTAQFQLEQSWSPKSQNGNAKWPAKWAWLVTPVAWCLTQIGEWYFAMKSPEEAVSQLTPETKVFVISAENDRFIPQSASAALWNSVLRSKTVVRERWVMPGDHVQPGPGGEAKIGQIFSKVCAWLKAQGLL